MRMRASSPTAAVEVVRPLAVDVDVDERPHLAALVEDEIADGERPERVADGRRVDVELLLAAGLGRQQAGEEHDRHR